MFIDGTFNEKRFDFIDVFGRDAFYYENSTLRIVAWETPVSIMFFHGKSIEICFKKELLSYADDYVDPAPETDSSLTSKEAYYQSEPLRKLDYALAKYKQEGNPFSAVKLSQNEFREKLTSKQYFAMRGYNVFKTSFRACKAEALWFPVDVDAIITNDCVYKYHTASIIYAGNVHCPGYIDFDGNFYTMGQSAPPDKNKKIQVFSIKDGIKPLPCPFDLTGEDFNGLVFFKYYVVTADGTSIDYDGKIRPDATAHYKNVNMLNSIIYLLRDYSVDDDYIPAYLEIKAPGFIDTVDIDFVENVVVPCIKSRNALDKKAYSHFSEIEKLLIYAGLSQDFYTALRNIINLNNARVFGGTKRGFSSARILKNLNTLKNKVSKKQFSKLLNDALSLKKEIALINGAKVEEISVSEKAFNMLVRNNRIAKEIQRLPQWQNIEKDVFVIFKNPENESFAAVTVSLKSGIKIRSI